MLNRTPGHRTAVLQALLVTFLWSTSWVLIKVGLREVPALSFAGLRYSIAFLLLAVVLALRPEARRQLRSLQRLDWWRLIALGVVFYALTQGAQFVGLDLLPAMTLSLILSFSPAVVALLGGWWLTERVTPRQWGGIGLSAVGATVYFLPAARSIAVVPSALGLAVAGVGLLSNAAGSLLGRSMNRGARLHPLVVTVVSMGVGSILLLGTGLAAEELPPLGGTAWGIIGWLAAVNTALAFTLWNHTLGRLSAVESSVINNTMLIQISLLAWLVLDEPLSLRQAIGLLLAVVGAVLVQLPRRAPRRPAN